MYLGSKRNQSSLMKKGKESQEDKEVGGMKQYMLLVFSKALYVGVYDNLWGDSECI